MEILLYFLFLILMLMPGILLVWGAKKIKKFSMGISGTLIFLGSIFILISLIGGSGTFLFARFGTAEDLASFSLINVWIESGFKYLGLLCLAIGFLTHKS